MKTKKEKDGSFTITAETPREIKAWAQAVLAYYDKQKKVLTADDWKIIKEAEAELR
jgi:hypothetical protein